MSAMAQHAAALESLAATRFAVLRNLAQRMIRNKHDAEDVVQNALLSAHKNLGQFRADAKLDTWVGTIVLNHARMHLRNPEPRRRVAPDVEDSVFEKAHSEKPTPEETVIQEQQFAHLQAAILKLTPPLRSVLELRLRGFALNEIAEQLQLPVGTVKARVSRARVSLARRMR